MLGFNELLIRYIDLNKILSVYKASLNILCNKVYDLYGLYLR